jgi:hypothetical protein
METLKPWKKVIRAEAGRRGVHMGERNWRSGTGWYWFLTLECGHEEIRSCRYFQCTGFTMYTRADLLPAPKKARCSQCAP